MKGDHEVCFKKVKKKSEVKSFQFSVNVYGEIILRRFCLLCFPVPYVHFSSSPVLHGSLSSLGSYWFECQMHSYSINLLSSLT